MPLTATASLLDAVRAAQLLRPAQLSEIELAGTDCFPEARALAQHLLDRGWLTPFQVNQLLLGRAAELALGPYRLIERLGEGFGGTVFKARHTRMNRIVALRSIRQELLADAQAIQQFYSQVEAASRLSHDNLVHAYDAGPIGATHFLAVEYVAGVDLARLVRQTGPLPPPQACDYIAQAAQGLQHGCAHGLMHGGLTPSKLLVTQAAGSDVRLPPPDADGAGSGERKRDRPGMVKISDLGLGRLRRAARDDTRPTSPPSNGPTARRWTAGPTYTPWARSCISCSRASRRHPASRSTRSVPTCRPPCSPPCSACWRKRRRTVSRRRRKRPWRWRSTSPRAARPLKPTSISTRRPRRAQRSTSCRPCGS